MNLIRDRMYGRPRQRFNVFKFTVELLSVMILVMLVFVTRLISSPVNSELVSLFKHILDSILYMTPATLTLV